MRRYLITGGAGFIGSALCRALVRSGAAHVTVLDKLTYAGSMETLESVAGDARFRFVKGDICDAETVSEAFASADPDLVFHLAAESHVDRSIVGPGDFIDTNVRGTLELLQAACAHRDRLPAERQVAFRFVQVSTDEVYGSLGGEGVFTESSPFDPSSPYSASKAAGDHLASAWARTYGLPVITTHCSNNYGPFQFPEKLIPVMIIRALAGEPLPVYGTGQNVRDWLHVNDHVQGLVRAADRGEIGRTYVFGGRNERSNMEIVELLCELMDARRPDGAPHRRLISHVEDRLGHDFRYAIDPSESETALNWRAVVPFTEGVAETVDWFLANERWWRARLASVAQA